MIQVPTEEQMRDLGAELAGSLVAGDVVALVGPLGAGKTTLVRGLAVGLGVSERVSSPTFVIARRHLGAQSDLQHCDAYRVSSPDEFDDLALETSGCVTVVEWGRDFADQLSSDWLEVVIDRGIGTSDDGRDVRLTGHGDRWSPVPVRELTDRLESALSGAEL